MKVFLDNAATSPLTPKIKQYIISLLDNFYNPSSAYSEGKASRKIIEQSRQNVANFINGTSENVIFTSSGSAGNSLVIKGLTSENPKWNDFEVFYSPTAHSSMIKACESCWYHTPLEVNSYGQIDTNYLKDVLLRHNMHKPLVCLEWGNSEIGSINSVKGICDIVHKCNGIVLVDATGYIPSYRVDITEESYIDFLVFSGHKLHGLKGVGVVYKNSKAKLKPLIYGKQENEIFGGTENIIGIASLGKAVEDYDYSSVSSKSRDYVYTYILKNIPDCYLVGSPIEDRLPNNLYMCFKGISGESLMTLMDMDGIQISTGSACNSGNTTPSSALISIGMNKQDINSCVRLSFSGNEFVKELDHVCKSLKNNVEKLRKFSE